MFNPTRLVAVLTLLSVVAVAQQPQFTYLRFNEDLGNLTWNDAAMASNNATLGGTASFGFQRLGCSSLVAGMTSSSRCETGRSINFTGDFTIECWVRYSSTSTSTGAIYAFGSSTTGSFRCFRGGAAGVDGLLLRLPNGGDTTITGVTADTWHHVAWTYDESALEVTPFLNGVAQPAQPVTAAIDLSTWLTSTLCVGGHTSSNSWDGQIDEFRFWTEERSASDIMNLMLREIDPNVVMRLNGQ
ncbi:MAG: LamG domain-containing protein, partial [Planctomycetes bacterium]|nr:LamG domain-containing protein [Planctomycetota bacterium]